MIGLAFHYPLNFASYSIGRNTDIDDLMMNTLGAVIGDILFGN